MNNRDLYILLALNLITHLIRSIYEILKFKGKTKPNRLTFTLIFINMTVLWVSWFAIYGLNYLSINLPDYIKDAGLVVSIAGIILFFTALFKIKALENYEGDLISNGIYSKIRHPMYLSFIFWLAGYAIHSDSLLSIALAALFISNVLYWRFLEEKELIKRFPDYPAYKKKTLF